MPFIAWILVIWLSLSGGVTLASLIAKEAVSPKSTAAATTVSALLTAALYSWMVWAVIQLATT